MKAMKRARAVFLALLAGLCVPLPVLLGQYRWFLAAVALWRATRAQFQLRELVSAIDADCPPGYVSIAGRCLLMHS